MSNRNYPSDLTDKEWELIEPFIVKKKRRGPKSRTDLRQVVNAVFYLLRTGCQWRFLPKEYGNWGMVYGYFQRWNKNGLWHKINDSLRTKIRKMLGKEESPSAAIIDSQSVKTVQKGSSRGYDAGKKNQG